MSRVAGVGGLHSLMLSRELVRIPIVMSLGKTDMTEQLCILPFSKPGTCTSKHYTEFASFSAAQNNKVKS